MIRRLEKQQRSNGDGVNNNLSKLREDLEYVRVSFLHYCPAHDDMTYKYHYNFVFCDVSFSLHYIGGSNQPFFICTCLNPELKLLYLNSFVVLS
jgi:hypothetical protein